VRRSVHEPVAVVITVGAKAPGIRIVDVGGKLIVGKCRVKCCPSAIDD